MTAGASYIIIQDLTIDMVNNVGSAFGRYLHLHREPYPDTACGLEWEWGARIRGAYGDDTPFIELLHSKVHGFGDATSVPGEDGHGLYITSSDEAATSSTRSITTRAMASTCTTIVTRTLTRVGT